VSSRDLHPVQGTGEGETGDGLSGSLTRRSHMTFVRVLQRLLQVSQSFVDMRAAPTFRFWSLALLRLLFLIAMPAGTSGSNTRYLL
jgi:hypothetical protein